MASKKMAIGGLGLAALGGAAFVAPGPSGARTAPASALRGSPPAQRAQHAQRAQRSVASAAAGCAVAAGAVLVSQARRAQAGPEASEKPLLRAEALNRKAV